MDMTGDYRIAAPRWKVWEALNDPQVLRACIPGCETVDKISDTEFTARVTARVGPVSAKFGGKVTLSDLDPPNGYRISGEGQGAAAGFAKGGATVHLADDGAGTLLSYKVEAQVGGKLAQIGSRLIEGSARKMADDFFGRFAAAVTQESAADIAPAATEAITDPQGAALMAAAGAPPAQLAAEMPLAPAISPTMNPAPILAPAAPRPAAAVRMSPFIWVAALIVVVAIILYFFV
jgi:uncharacterized protein